MWWIMADDWEMPAGLLRATWTRAEARAPAVVLYENPAIMLHTKHGTECKVTDDRSWRQGALETIGKTNSGPHWERVSYVPVSVSRCLTDDTISYLVAHKCSLSCKKGVTRMAETASDMVKLQKRVALELTTDSTLHTCVDAIGRSAGSMPACMGETEVYMRSSIPVWRARYCRLDEMSMMGRKRDQWVGGSEKKVSRSTARAAGRHRVKTWTALTEILALSESRHAYGIISPRCRAAHPPPPPPPPPCPTTCRDLHDIISLEATAASTLSTRSRLHSIHL
ncbi:hypothetical protein LIA77_07120 [Sarocladium implicatum]|nr:hypothetical protein LIA77_07120 [Sarocladium implicatum]